MHVEVLQEPSWKRRIQIEVPADQVTREYDEVSRRFQRTASLPGFRKGKVPSSLVQKSFAGKIRQEVVNRLLDDAYRNAVREADINPISYPTIDKLEFNLGEPMTIHAIVEVKPELEFVDYKGMKLVRPPAATTDDDVDQALENLRERQAQYLCVEGRSAEADDMVIVDQEAHDEAGLKIPKGSGEDLAIPVGRRLTRPEFEEALIGAAAGDERKVQVDFPADADDPAFAGKSVTFTLFVKEVKLKELPELDEDFAAEIGDFETLDDLRSGVRADLERQAAQRAEESLRAQLVEILVERNPFDLPSAMVERYLDSVVESSAAQARRDPREAARFDPDSVREQHREMAQRLIRKTLLFETIQRLESIVVSEEDLDEHVARIAEMSNLPPRKMRISLEKEGKLARLHDELLEEKTFGALIALAEVGETS